MTSLLRIESAAEFRNARTSVDAEALAVVAPIVESVRREGGAAVRRYGEWLGDLETDTPIVIERAALEEAERRIDARARSALEAAATRIRAFAQAQLACLQALDVEVEGGRAGHSLLPLERVGCYAPGGRHPLPSSVLMTAIPARVAGVDEIVLASPKPTASTLAAAAIAGVDRVLAVGGAQAIAALAYGIEGVEACDYVCGPGNRFVTAAKRLVFGDVGIDMLAGPSELLVIADESADPRIIAADLIAQAEHDPAARPRLVAIDHELVERVDAQLVEQLRSLRTASVAEEALRATASCIAKDLDEACRLSDRIAPEHLELHVAEPRRLLSRLRHYGAVFLGREAAEVFGDYGVGPNHTLPTGAGARYGGGLSPLNFVRVTTWLHLDSAAGLVESCAALARLEGLEGHARAAEARIA